MNAVGVLDRGFVTAAELLCSFWFLSVDVGTLVLVTVSLITVICMCFVPYLIVQTFTLDVTGMEWK